MKLIPVNVRILHLPDINGNKSSVLLNQAVTRLTAVLLSQAAEQLSGATLRGKANDFIHISLA